jgi:hypothetical protein
MDTRTRKIGLGVCLLLVVAFSAGRYSAPTKVKEVIKTKIKTVKVAAVNVDRTTKITKKTSKTGEVVETTEIIDKSKEILFPS